MTAFRLALLGTWLLLTLLMGLGLRLHLGGRGGARGVHHLLYFVVTLGTLLLLGLALRAGQPWWPFVLLLALLLGMSRTRPGRPDHWQLALAVWLPYTGAAWWLYP